jgi:hypothetical protein
MRTVQLQRVSVPACFIGIPYGLPHHRARRSLLPFKFSAVSISISAIHEGPFSRLASSLRSQSILTVGWERGDCHGRRWRTNYQGDGLPPCSPHSPARSRGTSGESRPQHYGSAFGQPVRLVDLVGSNSSICDNRESTEVPRTGLGGLGTDGP